MNLSTDAEGARERARNPDGTFGTQAVHTEPGVVDLGSGDPSFDPAAVSFEAEGIEALLEDLQNKTEWPESQHYTEEDLAAIQDRIGQMEARLEYLRNRAPVTAAERFAAATGAFHEAKVASVEAAVDVMRDVVLTEHPDAVYLEVTESDQDYTTGMWPGTVYDKDGTVLGDLSEDDDLSDAAAWLPQDGDYWEHALVTPEDRPDVFHTKPMEGVKYMSMVPEEGGPR